MNDTSSTMNDIPSTPRFRRLVVSAVGVPLVLMAVLFGTMFWQITSLLSASFKVERSDAILAKTQQLLASTIDMETGVRAYMLTGDPEFLEPYKRSESVIDSLSQDLLGQMGDHPVEREYQTRIIAAGAQWREFAKRQIDAKRADPGYMSVARERDGKKQMDGIRDLFRQLVARETEVRDGESQQAHRLAVLTLTLVAGVAVGGGLVLAVLSRKQLRAISRTYESALATAQDLNQTLENRVADRTAELEFRSAELAEVNKELEAFSYSVSHDLRAPMRHISGFSDLIRNSRDSTLSADDRENLETIHNTARLAGQMVDDLLAFSRIGRASLRPGTIDLTILVAECRKELAPDQAGRQIEWVVGPLPSVTADRSMLKLAVQNLLSNAIKYTGTRPIARIEIGTIDQSPPPEAGTLPVGSSTVFFRDNGVGFDMAYAKKLFGVFQRLHRAEDFEGTGIGLANVRRIVVRSGGLVWALGERDRGATFFMALPFTIDKPAGPRQPD